MCVWGWTDAMKSLRLYLFISGTQCEWPMILKNVIWKQIDLIGMCFFVCRQRFMYVRQCVISAMIILTNIFMQRSTKLSVMIVFSFNIRYFDWKTTCARLQKDISNVNVSLIFRNAISHKANHRFDTSCIHYWLRKNFSHSLRLKSLCYNKTGPERRTERSIECRTKRGIERRTERARKLDRKGTRKSTREWGREWSKEWARDLSTEWAGEWARKRLPSEPESEKC